MKPTFYFPGIFVLLFLWSSISIFSQSVSPDKVITPVSFDKSEKLSSVKVIPPISSDHSWKDDVIPINEEFGEEFNTPSPSTGPDPGLRDGAMGSTTAATVHQNFAGVGIYTTIGGRVPPDPNGDVGPDHYMQMVEVRFQIFDKSGNSLYGPAFNNTLWDSTFNNLDGSGDPVVLYDEYADRWIASQRWINPEPPHNLLIAVSETGDPTGAWYRYVYEFDNKFRHPKIGVWPDGYYFTIDCYSETGVCVVDRTAMIAGDPTARLIMFTTPYRFILPSDADGATMPPAGSPAYMMCLESSLKIWEVSVDWETPSNSSMTYATTLYRDPPYPAQFSRISQPGTTTQLEPYSLNRIMYRLQYRNFGTHEVLLTNHTVNVDGQTGIEWYEIRNTGSGWDMYQQGAFAPSDGDARWMGSMAMNGKGDIALGYSVSSSSTYPSIRIAGQTATNSGTGILDVDETSIFEGYASQPESPEWGTYTMMAVDPSDDETFWYTNEYSRGRFFWETQIASFTIAPYCRSYGNSTAREWIETMAIGSYTNNSGDNGGYLDNTSNTISVESGQSCSFTGTPGFSDRSRREFWRVWIDFNANGDFSDEGEEVFAANGKKGSVSGSISIPGGLTGDTRMRVSMKYNAVPDPCEQIPYGEVEDYKLTFTTPVPQPPVADFEGTPTTVTVGNSVDFTDLSLNNPTSWNWTFAGGMPETSTEQNPTVTYNTEGTYAVSLIATNDEGSDTKTVADYITVNPEGTTTYCESSSQSNAQEWIAKVDIDGFSNPSGASLYSDFTGLTVDLTPGSSSNVVLTPGYSGNSQREFWRIWIDFNSDGDFEDEGEEVFVANNKKNEVSGTMSIPSSATGQTRMRISMKNGSSPGPCETFPGGEVEDYTANFISLKHEGISRTYNKDRDLVIFPNPNNGSFQVKIEKEIHPEAQLKVYDMKGVLLYDMPVRQSLLELDLSELGVGIYQISVINGNEYYYSKLLKQ
ncbi:MAG: PKD domain-containing protein [Bacteroidales bacterium]|nr:PKD domain-containing protein [Bacteroidales bacterium]